MSRFIDRVKVQKSKIDVPFINFPSEWEIKLIPEFGETVVSFIARQGEMSATVRLETIDRIGDIEKPYWLAFPNKSRAFRCDMEDVEGLLSGIRESFSEKPLDNQFSPD